MASDTAPSCRSYARRCTDGSRWLYVGHTRNSSLEVFERAQCNTKGWGCVQHKLDSVYRPKAYHSREKRSDRAGPCLRLPLPPSPLHFYIHPMDAYQRFAFSHKTRPAPPAFPVGFRWDIAGQGLMQAGIGRVLVNYLTRHKVLPQP